MEVADKSRLEIALTPYNSEPRPRGRRDLEQYPTPTWLVAHMTWLSYMKGDVAGATIADYGCGDGRIAVSALLVGAARALCIDVDETLLIHGVDLVKKHFGELLTKLLPIVGDATSIYLNNVDVVLMNPPFGVVRKNRGLDLRFLLSALENSKRVYSIHKHSEGFIKILDELSSTKGLKIEWLEVLSLEIPMLYLRHRRKVHRIRAVLVVLSKGD